MQWWHGDMGWHWGWMLVVTALMWMLLVAVCLAVMRRLIGVEGPGNPQRVLAERFARGEIDEEEYRRRRQILERRPGDPSPR